MSTLPTRRPSPHPVDPATQAHLRGVFAPQLRELDVPDLVIDGELPVEIEGDYLRNGPNPRYPPLGRYLYPLDGDGMVHRIQFRDGRARYTNRFVRTPSLIAEEAAGRALWPGITTVGYTPGPELVGPRLAHTVKDRPSVNIVRHGGRLLALAESRPPFVMSTELETVERETFSGIVSAGITAHPKVDPVTGEMVVFCYGLTEPYLTWSIIGCDGLPVRAQTPVEGVVRPSLVHDMALTTTFVVLVVAPLFFDIDAAVSTGSPLSWEPEHGTRIALIPRHGGPTRWLISGPFWSWHTANAHDIVTADGSDRVVMDYVEWSAPAGFAPDVRPTTLLKRLTLDPAAGTVAREVLAEQAMEFPRIDDRALTGPHRQISTVLSSGLRGLLPGDADALGWYDTTSGALDVWPAGNLAVGEQSFVPCPGDPDLTHGWWIAMATDRTELSSQLLVMPAADPTSGPVATVRLPQRVPLGLHGAWLPADG